MKINIRADLPNYPKGYREVRFVARPSDAYNPTKTAEKFGELLEYLCNETPRSYKKINKRP